MKLEKHPQELTQVPFSKTECGVDFNINTDTHERLRGVLMEYPSFKTNFFELFFLQESIRVAALWLSTYRVERQYSADTFAAHPSGVAY